VHEFLDVLETRELVANRILSWKASNAGIIRIWFEGMISAP
jgi:hypothetical protein